MTLSTKDQEFIKRLLATFKIEAAEHLQHLSLDLVTLEKGVTQEELGRILERSFREIHSLKGAARAVNQTIIETVCHALEDVFSSLKKKSLEISPALLDLLHEATDFLSGMLPVISSGGEETYQPLSQAITKRLKDASLGLIVDEKTDLPAPMPSPDEKMVHLPSFEDREGATIRVDTARLDDLMLQMEELLSVKLVSKTLTAEINNLKSSFTEWEKKYHAFKNELTPGRSGGQEQLSEIQDLWKGNMDFLRELSKKISRLAATSDQNSYLVGRIIDELLGKGRELVMQPFSSVLELFPKLLRDMSKQQGKEAELVIQGGEIEVDRRIAEEIKEILIHIIRNCIDHGLETPAMREQYKKVPRGKISIILSPREGKKIEIAVSDDGQGIDLERVKAAAVKRGIISPAEAAVMTADEALQLVFHSGVSTSPIVTEVSGRGLGLAILREKTEKLGGSISIETEAGRGTTFRLLLPLTISTLRGLLVEVQGRQFVIPGGNIDKVARIKKEHIRTVENRETVQWGESHIALVKLAELFRLTGRSPEAEYRQVVVVTSRDKKLALEVDEIGEEQEILLKNLGTQLIRVRHIAGATVLGDMKVVPVINIPELIASAMKRPVSPETAPAPEPEKAKGKILVADDSITSRSLLKNILESSGYEVKTAVDGSEAFLLLKEGAFDLLVSDVDMPKVNGFELTAKIRADRKLSELPVILVTALSSREDRERGIEVGADAYIVKGDFDQSNLLEMIERFI